MSCSPHGLSAEIRAGRLSTKAPSDRSGSRTLRRAASSSLAPEIAEGKADGQRYVSCSRGIGGSARTRHWFSSRSEPPDSYVLIVMLAIWYARFPAAPIRV